MSFAQLFCAYLLCFVIFGWNEMVKKVARKMFVKLTSDDISKNQYGKRDEVEFSKVDKRS